MFQPMMRYSAYSQELVGVHSTFFQNVILPRLGPHPKGSTVINALPWKSFMNDDYTPIEFSWSWSAKGGLPVLRFGVEIIRRNPTLRTRQPDVDDNLALVAQLSEQDSGIHLQWLQHFANALSPIDTQAWAASQEGHSSRMFLAFELYNSPKVKGYIILGPETPQASITTIELVARSLRTLPSGTSELMQSFNSIHQYLENLDATEQARTEMLAIDCIDPKKARIKIYLRSPRTSFDSVLQMICLGGRLQPWSNSSIHALRTLWKLTLSLNDAVSDADPLPSKSHRTAGIIYYFDIRIGASVPACKVYIPVKHYGQDDQKIATGFQKYLDIYDLKLNGACYLEAVREMCYHRRLDKGLGFHTYISATESGENLAVSSYLQPEIYHPCRHR
ncbi:aromatic prenyltransferase [Pleomassaria siparia CBS 279.74]|uniref:Aromatic prenyltransferase n=1 Tax=Pleomassaria siparia CBS 279.74 TaxID=1314801 RepID=A0A6G1KFX5_9PLEO|nr:aromatic prenyltransferase [Pleomassaria siparia CBS 279.74]